MLAMAWLNAEAYDKAAELLRDDPGRAADPSLRVRLRPGARAQRPRRGGAGRLLAAARPARRARPSWAWCWARPTRSRATTSRPSGRCRRALASEARRRRGQRDARRHLPEAGQAAGGRGGAARGAARATRATSGRGTTSRPCSTCWAAGGGGAPAARGAQGAGRTTRTRATCWARSCWREARPPEAVEHLEAAARLAPEDANIHYQLGQAYQKLGPHGARRSSSSRSSSSSRTSAGGARREGSSRRGRRRPARARRWLAQTERRPGREGAGPETGRGPDREGTARPRGAAAPADPRPGRRRQGAWPARRRPQPAGQGRGGGRRAPAGPARQIPLSPTCARTSRASSWPRARKTRPWPSSAAPRRRRRSSATSPSSSPRRAGGGPPGAGRAAAPLRDRPFQSVEALLQLARLQSSRQDAAGALESLRAGPRAGAELRGRAERLRPGRRWPRARPSPAILALEPLDPHVPHGRAVPLPPRRGADAGGRHAWPRWSPCRRPSASSPTARSRWSRSASRSTARKRYAEAKPSLSARPGAGARQRGGAGRAGGGGGGPGRARGRRRRTPRARSPERPATPPRTSCWGMVRMKQERYAEARDALETSGGRRPRLTQGALPAQPGLRAPRRRGQRAQKHVELYQAKLQGDRGAGRAICARRRAVRRRRHGRDREAAPSRVCSRALPAATALAQLHRREVALPRRSAARPASPSRTTRRPRRSTSSSR